MRKRKPGNGRAGFIGQAGRKRGLGAGTLNFYEQNWPLINYLLPAYGEQGENLTLIGLEGGAVKLEPYRLKTALNRLGRVFSLNLADLRKRCGRIVSRCHTAPLVITPSLVLLPLRVRNPRFRDDGATGYVVYHKIKQIVPIEADSASNADSAGSADMADPENRVAEAYNATARQINASRLVFQDGTELAVLQRTSSLDRLFGEAFRVVQGISFIYNAGSSVSEDDFMNNPWSDSPGGGIGPGTKGFGNYSFNYPIIYFADSTLDTATDFAVDTAADSAADSAKNAKQPPKRENRSRPRLAMVQVPVIICGKYKADKYNAHS